MKRRGEVCMAVDEDFDGSVYAWGYWADDAGKFLEQMPEGLTERQAVAWGRERAPAVRIRPLGSDYLWACDGASPPDAEVVGLWDERFGGRAAGSV